MGIKLSRGSLIAHHNSPINSHQPTIASEMTSFLCKSKATILDLTKMLPDAHIAEVEDYEAWG
jgi:hypothetical protein